ncbi:protein kinase domain-containing protein [Acetobacterium bakii]|uniref:Protein kinase domain-containing protein n=1 Tax=Acetobacterium bakii TaxID=52689 RepID=A0A0L6TXH1_9FIRM|nr:protein kinase [Acetobacterium bakii]KNZ40956.1 hypothetical protein AKG39_14710 [Acetobacterium bakii]
MNGDTTLKGVLSLYGYHFCDILGSGDFGTCYEISRNGEAYVLKVFKHNHVKRRKSKLFMEIDLLNKVNHPGIPKIFKVIDKDGVFGFIMEKMPGHTLSDLINWDYAFSKIEIVGIMSQLIQMIETLHAADISHRDIKTTNILFFHGTISLIDFGSAKIFHSQTRNGNPDFWGIGDVFMRLALIAPEISLNPQDVLIESLNLSPGEKTVIKRLLCIEGSYADIKTLIHDFEMTFCIHQ